MEIPKVFGGKRSEVDAALFLKNKQAESKGSFDELEAKADENEASLPKDRKTYY